MNSFYISIFALVSVFCEGKTSCENYVHKCYAERSGVDKEYGKSMKRRRKAVVLRYCLKDGGYIK